MRFEVILDSGETPNKCTIAPLVYRKDFRLIGVTKKLTLGPLRSDLLLHPEGECLTNLREQFAHAPPTSIAAIDCIWRRLSPILKRVEGSLPVLARIPAGIVTAYPRKADNGSDPDGGLATIEAIFVAAALLGNWDPTLLSEYYFGRKFVELNAKLFFELGIEEALDTEKWPVLVKRPKTSAQRKVNRKVGFPTGVEV